MTGFGAAAGEHGRHHLRVEVRSVNHRHLLVKSRLGSDFSFLEGDVERSVRGRLSRGSVTVGLVLRRPPGAAVAAIDEVAAARYREELERLAQRLGLGGSVDVTTLIGLPGVVVSPEEAFEPEELAKSVLSLVDEAVGRLIEMRETEGAALARDLASHRAALADTIGLLAERVPTVVQEQKEALVRRIDELAGSNTVSAADVAREVAILADRLDVSEELARLGSHLEQLDRLMEGGGAVGRKLDFLVQELFREVNTVGSKCSDARMAHWVVDAKTHVERMREQVQNVE